MRRRPRRLYSLELTANRICLLVSESSIARSFAIAVIHSPSRSGAASYHDDDMATHCVFDAAIIIRSIR